MKFPGLYVPLYVNYPRDEDIRRAGEAAELLFVRGLAYAKANGTDGRIPDYDLDVVGAGLKGLGRRAEALVGAHELWVPVDGGWQIRSWNRWNETTEQVEEKKRRDAERQARKRERDKPSLLVVSHA